MAIEKGIQAACHELEALRVIEIHTGHAATIDRWKRMCFLINPYTTLGTLYLALNVGCLLIGVHGVIVWKDAVSPPSSLAPRTCVHTHDFSTHR